MVCRMALNVLYQLQESIWEENGLGIGRNFWRERCLDLGMGCSGWCGVTGSGGAQGKTKYNGQSDKGVFIGWSQRSFPT